jgi:hypothetical protein
VVDAGVENLDVANFGTLWRAPGSWPWALALQSPGDAAWRLTRAISPIVEAQQRLGRRADEWVDRLDVVDRSGVGELPAPELEPQLAGDASTFWLVAAYGPDVMADTTERVARMVEGFDSEAPAARHFTRRLIDTAESAGVPVYLYVAPFSPDSALNPRFAAAEQRVTEFWSEAASTITSDLVTVEPGSMTPEFADRAVYFDIVHMADAGPFADVLAGRLCGQWRSIDPNQECAP